jgi:FkbM family methyltransferase
MRRLLRRITSLLGWELRRLPDPALPFVQEIACDGLKFSFWIANQHAKNWWHVPELYLNAELLCQREMCARGSVVFDVGAHHGLTSILSSLWVGTAGRVHAFEANPENALVLSANVGLNHLDQCTLVNAAVGSKSGVVSLAGERVVATNAGRKKVPLLSLDDYCEARGIERVDVLKIDVEGYEAEVLRGARYLLAGRPKIDLELHLDDVAQFGCSPADVLAHIDLTRYRGSMMVRPDWDTLHPLHTAADLPEHGVVNLFLWPAA